MGMVDDRREEVGAAELSISALRLPMCAGDGWKEELMLNSRGISGFYGRNIAAGTDYRLE